MRNRNVYHPRRARTRCSETRSTQNVSCWIWVVRRVRGGGAGAREVVLVRGRGRGGRASSKRVPERLKLWNSSGKRPKKQAEEAATHKSVSQSAAAALSTRSRTLCCGATPPRHCRMAGALPFISTRSGALATRRWGRGACSAVAGTCPHPPRSRRRKSPLCRRSPLRERQRPCVAARRGGASHSRC